jgi:hypothetical protein
MAGSFIYESNRRQMIWIAKNVLGKPDKEIESLWKRWVSLMVIVYTSFHSKDCWNCFDWYSRVIIFMVYGKI